RGREHVLVCTIPLRFVVIDCSCLDGHFSERVEDVAYASDLYVEVFLFQEILQTGVVGVAFCRTQHALLPFLVSKAQCPHELLAATAVADDPHTEGVARHRTGRWWRHRLDVKYGQDRLAYFLFGRVACGGSSKQTAYNRYADESLKQVAP